MRLIICQFSPLLDDVDQSLRKLEALLQCDQTPYKDRLQEQLLILPEMFATGFAMNDHAQTHHAKVVDALQTLARFYRLNIIAGIARDGFNQSVYFNALGEIEEAYSKQKLFTFANEPHYYRPGNSSCVIELTGRLKVALFICYDLRFPELFRKVAKNIQMVVIIANWPQTRQMHWQALLRARAIENQCYVLGVNRIGVDGNDLEYAGGSLLFDCYGNEVFDAQQSELFTWNLNEQNLVTEVAAYRKRFPALQDMSDKTSEQIGK